MQQSGFRQVTNNRRNSKKSFRSIPLGNTLYEVTLPLSNISSVTFYYEATGGYEKFFCTGPDRSRPFAPALGVPASGRNPGPQAAGIPTILIHRSGAAPESLLPANL